MSILRKIPLRALIMTLILAAWFLIANVQPGFAQDPTEGFFDVPQTEADPNKAAVYGYIFYFIFAGLSLFAICKSARR